MSLIPLDLQRIESLLAQILLELQKLNGKAEVRTAVLCPICKQLDAGPHSCGGRPA